MVSFISKRVDWLLVLALGIGSLARLWGINFGLPNPDCRPDETAVVSVALGFFSGDLNPHFFAYPTFYPYLLFIIYSLYFIAGLLTGHYQSIEQLTQEFVVDPTNFYLINRLLAATFGIATILIVYWIADHLFQQRTAQIAAIFLSLAYLHVRDSHFGVTDVPLTFFVMVSVLFLIKSYDDRRYYGYAGLFAGLATSLKYPGLLLIVPLLIVHGWNVWRQYTREPEVVQAVVERRRQKVKWLQPIGLAIGFGVTGLGVIVDFDFVTRYLSTDGTLQYPNLVYVAQGLLLLIGFGLISLSISLRSPLLLLVCDRLLLLFLALMSLGFLVGSPFALLDFKAFAGDFLSAYLAVNDASRPTVETGWLYHFRLSLPLGLGLELFAMSLFGIVIFMGLGFRRSLILLSFPFLYYLIFGKAYTVMVRYMVPIVPFLCITAAAGLVSLCLTLSDYYKLSDPYKLMYRLERVIPLFFATLLILPSTHRVIQFNTLLSQPDNRLVATAWLEQHIPRSASIYQTGYLGNHLELNRSPKILARETRDLLPEGSLITLLQRIESFPVKVYKEWRYDPAIKQFRFDRPMKAQTPDYIITSNYPFTIEPIPAEITKRLKTDYRLKQSFIAIDMNEPGNIFNEQDAFYLPYAGFKVVQRPGPNLFIYEKR